MDPTAPSVSSFVASVLQELSMRRLADLVGISSPKLSARRALRERARNLQIADGPNEIHHMAIDRREARHYREPVPA